MSQRDYEALYNVELSDELGPAWRLRGRTPSPDAYVQSLWAGVMLQFLVVRRGSDTPVGIVTIYGADPVDGYGYLSAAKFRRSDKSTLILQGAILLIDYTFFNFTLRKLYLEVNGYNLDQFESGVGRLLTPEGCLRDHTFAAGQYWNKHIFSIYKATWEDRAPEFRRLVHGVEPDDGDNGRSSGSSTRDDLR